MRATHGDECHIFPSVQVSLRLQTFHLPYSCSLRRDSRMATYLVSSEAELQQQLNVTVYVVMLQLVVKGWQ